MDGDWKVNDSTPPFGTGRDLSCACELKEAKASRKLAVTFAIFMGYRFGECLSGQKEYVARA
jgi:hypothetical protein